MAELGSADFIVGIVTGAILVYIIVTSIRNARRVSSQSDIAPSVLNLELKRAKRLDYKLALVLLQVRKKNIREMSRWLESLGASLRLREYDVILTWSPQELIILLPGVDNHSIMNSLSERIGGLLQEGGWGSVKYSMVLAPDDGEEMSDLLKLAQAG